MFVQATRKPRSGLKWALLGSTILVLAVAAPLTYLGFRHVDPPPPPVDAPESEIVRFLTTEQYEKLPLAEKGPYVRELYKNGLTKALQAAIEAKLTEEERRKAWENFVLAKVTLDMDAYFALPQGKERQDLLDQIIDADQAQLMGAPLRPVSKRPELGPAARLPPMWADPQKAKERIENTSPLRRAQFSEYTHAMMQRRAERGLGLPAPKPR